MEGQRAVLAVDGWSTLAKDPVIGISLCVLGATYLIKTEDTLGKPHTADYLAALVEENVKYAEDTFGVHVVGCVTDNASNMVATRRILQERLPKVCKEKGFKIDHHLKSPTRSSFICGITHQFLKSSQSSKSIIILNFHQI